MVASLCVDGSTGSRSDPQEFHRNNYLRLRAMDDRASKDLQILTRMNLDSCEERQLTAPGSGGVGGVLSVVYLIASASGQTACTHP